MEEVASDSNCLHRAIAALCGSSYQETCEYTTFAAIDFTHLEDL